MKNVFVIAHNTFREALRDRIMLVAMIMCILFVLATFKIVDLTVTQWQKMVTDFSMSVMRGGGLIMVFLLGASVVGKELKRRTAYVIFSRPLKKWEFIWGKYFGIMALLAANLLILLVLAYIVTIWVHFKIGVEVPPLIFGYFEFISEISVLTAFVIMLSVIYTEQFSVVGLFIFFGAAHLIGPFKDWLFEGGTAAKLFGYLLSIFPDFSIYKYSEEVTSYVDRIGLPAKPIPWSGILISYLIAAVFSAFFLIIATRILKRRELGE